MFTVVGDKGKVIRTLPDFQQAMAYATKLAYAQPTAKKNVRENGHTTTYKIVEV